MVCSFPYHSSSSAQSPNWPACKKLNISELSAREGLLFYFREFPQAVRQSHQFPTLATFNFSANLQVQVRCLEIPDSGSTCFLKMAPCHSPLRYEKCGAVLFCCWRKLLSHDIPL
jgi:hypothetical protein